VRTANKFCDKFKPTWKDLLVSSIVPIYGISKSALYAACKGVINSGYLVDVVADDCCAAHDACYNRGGTLDCKNTCDVELLACTTTDLRTYIFGPPLALDITAAATAGGFATFNNTGDPYCGDTSDNGLNLLLSWFSTLF
jgi:hypothetical protein